ncbi:MAG: DUF4404 family protein [Gammaproteobacteria bacterium]|nr:DUF4404 family protein [Gammaproteobacteria bacterium]
MPEQRIRENLEHLRKEISQLEEGDASAGKRLNVLIDEIETGIQSDYDAQDQSLVENLQEAITHFETEHPRATAILNDIMLTLSNMGI